MHGQLLLRGERAGERAGEREREKERERHMVMPITEEQCSVHAGREAAVAQEVELVGW